ncbi:TMhelix containing protein [Vibrio phage 1.188.A._10N.286.51.A6]|uniref:TMhelix containing protein n=4 Tax=Mukerjeevirus TaxID=2733146 RepID=A0A2I7RJ20_9CAUD|nr:TMhelix containing protein [Vibrio phage 1.188.A._10N.286.51.A6]YP_009817762.1 TMhelix containing protein [Vibrio phage 1.261.O._10N.286.51.A7]AUR93735.1 TMhelix containing protein [Vibrio phage 1.188.B._10N.286.51.A6]AUR93821.1 TMhelix containing protein [Vibrio phage 1.188.C._10N.286.51.A6]AUR93649.1 TMhelix containing protein [Vibrio phage 1.188.A._10N.286.51.A6]AUR99081.1 TMhelix containing protein [Vibrio phage 1.261.O._10N.286.51.A7]
MSKFDAFFMAVVFWTVIAVIGIELVAGMDVLSEGFTSLFALITEPPKEPVVISVN